jgi:L-ascorbate metabolism protein UlaG (beta-lactamase superfamily)
MLIDKIHWLGHASFKIIADKGIVIYMDPFRLNAEAQKADIIFCSHQHYDHFSPEDIAKITKDNTVVVCNASCEQEIKTKKIHVRPGDKGEVYGIAYKAVPAYNLKIPNHRKELGHNGFILAIDGEKLYHAGDTDAVSELESIRVDVALLPVGGTYTMDAAKAAELAKKIGAKITVPMHYGAIIGTAQDGENFRNLCGCGARILKAEKA